MNLIGRWARVRNLDMHGWGQPHLLDRKWNSLNPLIHEKCPDGEYWKTPSGEYIWTPDMVVPTIRGGVGWSATTQGQSCVRMGLFHANMTRQNVTLSNNYTYGSAGNAIASQLVIPSALTLNKCYFFIDSYNGTAANVNDINFEFRNHSSTKPGSTAHATATKDPASATGWIAITGLSFALVADTLYWAVIGDADGGGTDNAVVLRNINSSSNIEDRQRVAAYSTTDGWATVVTAGNALSSLCLTFSNGLTIGNPLTTSTAPASSTNARGWNFSSGFTNRFSVYGMSLSAGGSIQSNSGMQIWADNGGPSGTPAASTTSGILVTGTGGSAPTCGYILSTPHTVKANTPYRMVFTFSGARTDVPQYSIGTGSTDDLLSTIIGGGGYYYALANGTTDWSNDVTTAFPGITLIIEDLVSEGGAGMLYLGRYHRFSNGG